MDESLILEVWDRLYQGSALDDLSLPVLDGRLDLRGISLPDPAVIRRYQTSVANVTQIEPSAKFHGVKWENLDFSGSKLKGMRMFGCQINNCRFDKCNLEDLRWWSMAVTDTSFRGANLKKSALGGIQEGRRNLYQCVDFSEADLRQTAYKSAAFENCRFFNSKLVKIDFQGSTFTDCVFEGELREVLFHRRGFQGESYPANEMLNIDFRGATLRHVEFRGLSLENVQFPNDSEHLVLTNFDSALDKAIGELKSQEDLGSRKLVAYLSVLRKWAVRNQPQGVLNTKDMIETGGLEGFRRLEKLLRALRS